MSPLPKWAVYQKGHSTATCESQADHGSSQLAAGAAPGGEGAAEAGAIWFFWKQDRHKTGLPCVGRNGTVVSSPQAEHRVLVSVRTLGPPVARFALHCLQRLGSFLKSLS
jgi:hypothetical protein